MAYKLEGSILEVCDCNVLCPCWVGEKPDNGTCQSALAYHFDRGTIDGLDVSGLTFAVNVFIPGNPLEGNWRAHLYVDERASPEQEAALLGVFTGKQGGPVADLAALVGEVVKVERRRSSSPCTREKAPCGSATRPKPRWSRFVGRGQAGHPGRQHLLDDPRLARLSRKGLGLPDEEPGREGRRRSARPQRDPGQFAFEA
jgi:hypothetical protein